MKKAHKGVCFAYYSIDDGTVDVLIGSEYLEKYLVFKRSIVNGDLTLSNSYVGYVVSGFSEKSESTSHKIETFRY